MNIFAKLPKLRAAKDFADTIPDVERELADTEASVADLHGKLEAALFGKPGEAEKLKAEIVSAEARVADLRVALEGAKRRQAEAEKSEAMIALEARMKAAAETDRKLQARCLEFHAAALVVAAAAEDIKRMTQELLDANRAAVAGGRKDLEIPSLQSRIVAHRLKLWEAFWKAKTGHLPVNPPTGFADPLTGLHIAMYYPPKVLGPNDSAELEAPEFAFLKDLAK